MALAGPRLDRPSAVGEEGRPRATSLTIAGLTVTALLLVTAYALLGRFRTLVVETSLLKPIELASQLALPVALTVIGLALLNRQRVATKVVGHIVFLLGGTVLVVLLFGFSITRFGLLLVGFTVALFGVAAAWTSTADRETLVDALSQSAVAYVVMLFGVAAFLLVSQVSGGVWSSLVALTLTGDPAESLVGVALLVGVDGALVWLGLRTVPLMQFVAPERREWAWRLRERGRRVAKGITVAGFVVAVLGTMFWSLLSRLATDVPALGFALALSSTVVVVLPLVLVGASAVLVTVATSVADRLANRSGRQFRRLVGALVAGVLFAVLLVPVATSPLAVGTTSGTILAGAFFAPVVVLVLGGTVVFLIRVGLVPDRATGPVLAAGGLVVATVGAAFADLPAPLVFALAAGALLVWDVSAFGLGLTAELGHIPETRRLELYHGVVSVGVAVAAVLVTSGLYWVYRTVGAAIGGVSVAALAVVGVVFLSVPLAR